jgi:NO-binding membrane sensor protein with MHYT domain
MLAANNFTYGLLTPILGYAMSCLGAFIGLRCTVRAYAYEGAARARWLTLAAVSIGATGCWLMHFIAMLGYTVPGMAIRYNVPLTIVSMLIAVVVVAIGLFIVGFGKPTLRNLVTAGVITGIGVSSMHYSGMAAMQMQATMNYQPALVGVSVFIGIVAATVALWAALRLRGIWSTLGASLILGVGVSGLHYTGMAAMTMSRAPAAARLPMNGATPAGFLLPLVIGLSVVSIVMTAILLFSPNEEEIREDADLMARINAATARLSAGPPLPTTPAARWPAPGRHQQDSENGRSGENGAFGRYGPPPGRNGQAGHPSDTERPLTADGDALQRALARH